MNCPEIIDDMLDLDSDILYIFSILTLIFVLLLGLMIKICTPYQL